jgi:hypothetical protein
MLRSFSGILTYLMLTVNGPSRLGIVTVHRLPKYCSSHFRVPPSPSLFDYEPNFQLLLG